jgi:hypothetical protein
LIIHAFDGGELGRSRLLFALPLRIAFPELHVKKDFIFVRFDLEPPFQSLSSSGRIRVLIREGS